MIQAKSGEDRTKGEDSENGEKQGFCLLVLFEGWFRFVFCFIC
jgi:hypothetical protein